MKRILSAFLKRAPAENESKYAPDAAKKKEYQPLRILGKGAQGQVEEAIHKPSGRHVALKTIRKSASGGPGAVHSTTEDIAAAWRREVAILQTAKLHPNVCELIDYFEDKTNFYMVFALATGGELFDRVVARGRLTERDSALILATLCNVLSFLHAHGIVHRDLRTKNMVFKDPSPNSPLLLVDFGIANRIEGNRERLRTQIGTPLYTAPEVWDGDGYGTPADMFSLGIIAHTLLTGSPPTWTGGKVRRLAFPHPAWRVLSPESRNFVKELLSMSPFTRMTAERAMDHPWLRKFLSKEEISRLHQVNSEAFISTGPPRNLETLMPGLLIDELWSETNEPYWGLQFQATEAEFEWIAWLDDLRVASNTKSASSLLFSVTKQSESFACGLVPGRGKSPPLQAVLTDATLVAPVAVHADGSISPPDPSPVVVQPIPIPPTPPSESPPSVPDPLQIPPRPSSTREPLIDELDGEHSLKPANVTPRSIPLPNLLEKGDYGRHSAGGSPPNSPPRAAVFSLLSKGRSGDLVAALEREAMQEDGRQLRNEESI